MPPPECGWGCVYVCYVRKVQESKERISVLYIEKQVAVLIFSFHGHFAKQVSEPGNRVKRKCHRFRAFPSRTRAEAGERMTNRSASLGYSRPFPSSPASFPYRPLGVGVCSRLVPPPPLSDRTVDSNISSRTHSLLALALAELRCVCPARARGLGRPCSGSSGSGTESRCTSLVGPQCV